MYNMDITIPVINYKVSLEVLILIGVVYLIMAVHTVCSCCNVGKIMEGLNTMKKEAVKVMKKEGFSGANTNYGESSAYDINVDTPVDTSSWMQGSMVVQPGKPVDPAVKAILDRPKQPVPLPEGEMLMFANTPFKPECCPSTYSNSQGCACITVDQYNGLVTRFGNNVPYSEY
jgi:hypothetical protein